MKYIHEGKEMYYIGQGKSFFYTCDAFSSLLNCYMTTQGHTNAFKRQITFKTSETTFEILWYSIKRF